MTTLSDQLKSDSLDLWPKAADVARAKGFVIVESGEAVPRYYEIRDAGRTVRFWPTNHPGQTVLDFVNDYARQRTI